MREAYLDLWTGLSGDMMVGAIVDAGWPEEEIQTVLDSIGIPEVRVAVETRRSHGLAGKGIRVTAAGEPPARSFREIRRILVESSLEPAVRDRSVLLFRKLAEVEGRLHDADPEGVHFHELGAIDSIADIVLAVAGLRRLGVERLSCGEVPVSRGIVETAHGPLPVPAPATLRLLEGLPIRWLPIEGEWLTPTGALILSTLVDSFGPPPGMRLGRVGIGVGTRKSEDRANIVRLLVGEDEGRAGESVGWVSVIEANIDDLDPRHEAEAVRRLEIAGALDVFRVDASMKKGRRGAILTVLCRPDAEERLGSILLQETTTLGVRIRREIRRELERWITPVETPYGEVRIKWSRFRGLPRPAAEFEDLRLRAEEAGVPTWVVERAALRAAEEGAGPP